jgi:hypothetical protein
MSDTPARSELRCALSLAAGLAVVSLGYFALLERAVAWIATADAGRARALARAGLEASLCAVSAGKSGTLGSPPNPACFERGRLCVETRRTGPYELRLVATAEVGLAREQLELVLERGTAPARGSSFQGFRLR